MTVSLKFCGAARTVTGSCFWFRTPVGQFLVDCGLFQGTKTLKQLNYDRFPFDPKEIDFVLVTHAHIDHAGLLPKLCKLGFSGPIYLTPGSADLLSFMLPDSGYIQEMEVRYLNERNQRRGKPTVAPIYTKQDGESCPRQFKTIDYESWATIKAGLRVRFWNAGHILGSASIELELADDAADGGVLRLLFSGDLGPDHKLFHPDPTAASDFDYVICETTYGGRTRAHAGGVKRRALLAREVTVALANDGILLVPSFAVERTQELLADLSQLQARGTIPAVPIFVDSPLAIRATEAFERHADELEGLDATANLFDNSNIRFTEAVEQSKAINRISGGAIIMAASGMCDAGRIRHHLKARLWNAKTTVLIVGYMAEGTLGRLLLEGRKMVRIQGQELQVRAKIRKIDAYSGHADHGELLAWLRDRRPITRGVFLVHGEEQKARAMQSALGEAGFDSDKIFLPSMDDEIELLSGKRSQLIKAAQPRLAPEAVPGLDWHNTLAQFQIDARQALEAAPDRAAKAALLRRLRRVLDDAGNP